MNSLKAIFVYVMMAFVGMVVFASCGQDDITGHDDSNNTKGKIVVKDKDPEDPKPVLTDTIYGKIVNDSLVIVHDSLRNDTIFKTEQISLGFSAKISRKDDERKTTVERIKKLDFSFEDAQNKQNGKLQFIGSQNGNDADGQSYTLDFNSEKVSKWGLNDVHFELVGTNTPEVKNTDIEKKASDSIRIKSEMTWPLTVKVVNVPNLKDKEFKSSMLNNTAHERYISYGDPVLVKRDTTMTPTYGIWSTEWELKVVETYRVNGQDSVAPAQTKRVNLISTCGIDKLEDAFVDSLEFNHNFTSEKWGNWYDVESADKAVAIQERKFERLGTGSNGIAKDEFATRSFVTEQKATVVFANIIWNIPATAATLTNVRHTFLEQDSDLDGYSMIKFVDDEIATYAGATDGDNYKKLNSSCKLYLKVEDPDPEIITEYWDTFKFETDAKEYTDRVEYFLRWIKEYSDGKKTSTDIKVVLQRNAEGSSYTITVDDPQREIGEVSEEVPTYIARTESSSDIVINYDWLTSSFELPNVFDGNKTENDVATFVDPTNVKVTKKNSKGEDVVIELPSFEHQLTSTVSDLEKVSESDDLVEYTYTRTWSWASTQCTSTANSFGFINKIPEGGAGEPDFDIEVGKIFASVSRPSDRNGNPITAYTYLLVSKDGTKCLPIGIYKDVVTEGKIQDMHSTYNSACYVKDQNEVVPTNCYSHSGLGMMIWADKDGNPVDAETHTWLQGNGFNDRGNDWINHTGKYAPTVVKKGKGIVEVQFSGTSKTYTFRGWDVK